jgi:hypothetical protein
VTCIAGIVDSDGTVYIGGDSAGVSGWDLIVRADEKVFTAPGGIAFGFTTSFRMGQVLRYGLDLRTSLLQLDNGKPIGEWMVIDFVNTVRECFKSAGYASKDKEREEGGTFLVGLRGRLFEIGTDYQVGESLDGIHACGAGAQVALGALWAQRYLGLAPEQRVRVALEAAERFSAAVRSPFEIVSTA